MSSVPPADRGRSSQSPSRASSSPSLSRTPSAGNSRPSSGAPAARVPSQQQLLGTRPTPQDELASLKDQYARLEAKVKASTAVLHASVRQNRATVQALKQQHADLQARLTASTGGGGGALGPAAATQVDRTLQQQEREVHDLRRRHDRLMQDKRTTVAKLQHLEDALRLVQQQAGGPGGGDGLPGVMSALDMGSREARAMRQLENRLEKAALKANEAHSIRCMYEQVIDKMKAEELGFDARLQTTQEAARELVAERERAAKRLRDSQRRKEAAKHELSALEEQLAKERSERAATLAEARSAAQALSDTTASLTTRRYQRPEADSAIALSGLHDDVAQPRGDMTPRRAIAALCAAYAATQPDALCDRLVAQQAALGGLQEMKISATHQVDVMQGQLAQAQAAVQDAAAGVLASNTQTALDRAQAALRDAQAAADAARLSHDKTRKVFVDVRAGLDHLAAMLAPLPLPPGHIPVPIGDDTLGDVLAQCQQRVGAAQAFIRTIPKAAALLDGLMDNPELCFAQGSPGHAVSDAG